MPPALDLAWDPCGSHLDYLYDDFTYDHLISVNFHFIRDAAGLGNFAPDGSTANGYTGADYVTALVDEANDHLEFNWPLSIPPGNNLPNHPFKYRVAIAGIFYHEDTYLSSGDPFLETGGTGLTMATNLYGVETGASVNVFFVATGIESTEYVGIANPGGSWRSIAIQKGYQGYMILGGFTNVYQVARLFIHELGHSLSLRHTIMDGRGQCTVPNQDDGCSDTPNQNEMLNTYGVPPPSGCCPQDATPSTCSNNLMDYHPDWALSPEQLAVVHRELTHRLLPFTSGSHCTWVNTPRTIITGQHLTWTGAKILNSNLIIQSGASLTIKCGVHFPSGASLIVEPGGKLTIDGGFITNLCDERWSGIQVWGDNTQNQWGEVVGGTYVDFAHQGLVDLVNGGTIEHALVGISMQQPGVSGTSGGVVRSNGGVFRNCGRAVEFLSYQNTASTGQGIPTANRSYFYNTAFAIDADYRGNDDFSEHVSLWDVSGVTFSGCSFTNGIMTIEESALLGYGIKSLDASYVVRSSCSQSLQPGTACPEMLRTPCTFTGLDHGIHALQGSTARNFQVDGAVFTDNVCGVYAEGVIGFKVVNSTFYVGGKVVSLTNPLEFPNWNGLHRAIFSSGGYGFIIDDNELFRSGAEPTEGIVIGYCRGHNDMVFRNKAHFLDNGFVGEGICASLTASPYIGLFWQCNENEFNGVNFWSRQVTVDPTTFQYQTIRTNQGRSIRAADNVFDREPDLLDLKNTNLSNAITYWWASPVDPFKPQYVSDAIIIPGTQAGRPAGNCLSRREPIYTYPNPGRRDALHELLDQNKLAYGNSLYLYRSRMDGGDKDEVLAEIQSTWSQDAWDLREYLLHLSPYLSCESLKAAIDQPFFPEAMKAEVCIANPDATQKEGFLTWLKEDALYPMSESVVNSIQASWDNQTYRTQLENTLAYHHGEMTQAANLLFEYHGTDTLEQVDSLRTVWQLIRTPAARYAEALTYLQQGRYTEANDVIDGIPEEHELQTQEESERWRMGELITFVKHVAGDERTLAELDSAEIAALEALIGGYYDRPATWAQNILCFHYGHCRAPLSGGDGGAPKALRQTEPTAIASAELTLRIYPNPATGWAMLVVDLQTDPENAGVVIEDITGRLVRRFIVQNAKQQVLLDTRDLAPGTYSVRLESRSLILRTERLVVRQ